MKKSGVSANRLLSQLAVEKKKAATALCLIALMAFMWIRVLAGKTPQTAHGGLLTQTATFDLPGSDSQLEISFVQLPEVKGRNDVLARDFFAANGWADFLRGREGLTGVKEVDIRKGGSEETARRIARSLKLEAIALGGNPQAFINDKILSVGDRFRIGDGIGEYECEVVAIEKDTVFVRCGEVEVRLKFVQKNYRKN
ncbi:MAG: hypothetical protein ACYS8I_02260 [Planctomycetota bacterium]|jgi:hypothetical protein